VIYMLALFSTLVRWLLALSTLVRWLGLCPVRVPKYARRIDGPVASDETFAPISHEKTTRHVYGMKGSFGLEQISFPLESPSPDWDTANTYRQATPPDEQVSLTPLMDNFVPMPITLVNYLHSAEYHPARARRQLPSVLDRTEKRQSKRIELRYA
jgi:hypothetical protein